EVGIDRRAPRVLADLLDGAGRAEATAGVRHEDGDGPEARFDVASHGLDLVVLRHIADDLDRATAAALDLGEYASKRARVPPVQPDVRALFGKELGDGCADAARAARNERDLSFEQPHRDLSSDE